MIQVCVWGGRGGWDRGCGSGEEEQTSRGTFGVSVKGQGAGS